MTVAFALKKEAGVSVINCGSFYQHEPLKYRRMRSKGEAWARWPLSRTPISFHKLKDARALRLLFACSLYNPRGSPRALPRELFSHAYNASDAPWCTDPWRASSAPAPAIQ